MWRVDRFRNLLALAGSLLALRASLLALAGSLLALEASLLALDEDLLASRDFSPTKFTQFILGKQKARHKSSFLK